MKKCFVLCRTMTNFSHESVVFRLWVGSSRREQTMCALVENLSLDMGWFFRPADEDTDYLLLQQAKRLYPTSTLPLCHVKSAQMGIAKFYKLISDSNLEVIEGTIQMPANTFVTIAQLDAHTLSLSSFFEGKKSCLRRQRKNLSHSTKELIYANVMCAALLLVVLLVDALVTYIFNLS